jgi:hypothetical protein
VLRSSRHIRIEIAGRTLAESTRPALLFETGLPTRYYLPKQDVRMDLLEPSDTTTSCPYKGVAGYWSVRIGSELGKDLVWGYPAPVPRGVLDVNERPDARPAPDDGKPTPPDHVDHLPALDVHRRPRAIQEAVAEHESLGPVRSDDGSLEVADGVERSAHRCNRLWIQRILLGLDERSVTGEWPASEALRHEALDADRAAGRQ